MLGGSDKGFLGRATLGWVRMRVHPDESWPFWPGFSRPRREPLHQLNKDTAIAEGHL